MEHPAVLRTWNMNFRVRCRDSASEGFMGRQGISNSAGTADVTFHFGNFVVDEEARQLLRDGTPLHVFPKAFDLLATLIRERPRAVSRTELHTRLWPETYVSDASLAMLVAEVRAALGESAREPRFVRTVHRHGYAFQGTVVERARSAQAHQATSTADWRPPVGYWLLTPSGRFALPPGETIVGRDSRAGVWLDVPGISRRHARIVVTADGVTVEDLGSKNGTRLRDTRVTGPTPLEDGSTVRFGSVDAILRALVAEPTRTEADS